MGGISGRRVRFEVRPQYGTWQWTDYLVDARHYYPVLFNKITIASRFLGSLTVGRDEAIFPKWLGRPDLLRGYSRTDIGVSCGQLAGGFACNDEEAVGSRVMLFSTEARFPILRMLGTGGGVGLPPVDGLLFYDAGVAWNGGQELLLGRPADYDFTRQRSLLQSSGWGLRLNLFGLMMVRYDYAYPINRPNSRGFGTWWFGMSY
jgi:outer membrane protein assembly factor BamA